MKNGLWMKVVLTVMIMVWPLAAQAQPVSEPSEEKVAGEIAKMDDEIGLSPDQRQKMAELRKEFKEKQKGLAEQLKTQKEALRAELESDQPDRSRADKIVGEISKLQGQLMAGWLDHLFKTRQMMTPEQFKKSREIGKKYMMERMHGRAEAMGPEPAQKKGRKFRGKK